MATRIFNTTDQTITTLSLITDGQDFLFDVIGNSDGDGRWYTDRDDADFAMNEDDLAWWTRWAEREQVINDTAQGMGEDAINGICQLASEWGHDFEVLQDKCEEYLGLA